MTDTTTPHIEAMTLEEFIRRAIGEAQRSELFIQTVLNHSIAQWLFPRVIGRTRGMLIDEPTLTPPGADGVFAIECRFEQNAVRVEFRYLIHRTEAQINALVESCRGSSDEYLDSLRKHGRSTERSFTKTFPLRNPVW